MIINKYLRILIFGICYTLIYTTLHFIIKDRFSIMNNFEYIYLIQAVLTTLICVELERIFYDFKSTHNGNVKLRIKNRKE